MKCPLFCIGDRRVQLGEETEYGDCLKEECAWWDKLSKQCDIHRIMVCLETIASKKEGKL